MGIGGGSSSAEPPGAGTGTPPSPGFFFGGGGGGFFFPARPGIAEAFAVCACRLVLLAKPPTFSATPYFWFMLFAVCNPEATCSPCRCRKLFAVPAAALASANDTDEGSFWNDEAVLRAACFCAHVVP